MYRNPLQIYSLIICFVALMGMAIASWWWGTAIVDLHMAHHINVSLNKYEDNLTYLDFVNEHGSESLKRKVNQMSEGEITSHRHKAHRHELKTIRVEARRNIFHNIVLLLVWSCIFFFHWRMHRKQYYL